MAFSRFSFGVMAIVATLIFALVMPAAVHAHSAAPAPAPTSDGKWFYLFLHDARTHLHSNSFCCRSKIKLLCFNCDVAFSDERMDNVLYS